MVGAWGYFLYQGVIDPLGGINILWPLFGIANQLLAAIALVVATTIIIRTGRARYAWTTLLPLAWLLAVTMTAGYQKIFSRRSDARLPRRRGSARRAARRRRSSRRRRSAQVRSQIFNLRLDAAVTAFFMALVALIVVDAMRVWLRRGGERLSPALERARG